MLVESTKQPPMAQMGEPKKIISSTMHLLHERGFRINDTTVSQDTVNFFHDLVRIKHVFKYCLSNDAVERLLAKRDAMTVEDNASTRTESDVRLHEFNICVHRQRFHARTEDATAKN